MSASLLHLCRGTARSAASFSDELASLRQDLRDTMLPRDLADWVQLCLRFRDAAQQRSEQARRSAFAGEVRDFETLGNIVLSLFDSTLSLCRTVCNDVASAEAKGHAVTEARALLRAVPQLEATREAFATFWPRPNPEEWEKNRQAIAAGDCFTVEEVRRGQRA